MRLSQLVKMSPITFGLCLSYGSALADDGRQTALNIWPGISTRYSKVQTTIAEEETSSGDNQVKTETSSMIWLGIKTGFSQSDLHGLDECDARLYTFSSS